MLLGNEDSGKTTLAKHFLGKQTEKVEKTIGVDVSSRQLCKFEKDLRVIVYDCSGAAKYRLLAKTYMKEIDAFCLLIDLSIMSSLENVKSWIHMIQNNTKQNSSILLVGNKSDNMVIPGSSILQICNKLDLPYVEISA